MKNTSISNQPETQSGEWTGVTLPPQGGVAMWQEGLHSHSLLPLIIFDLDGTLLDSYEMALVAHTRVIEAMGLPTATPALLEALNGPTLEQACALLGLPSERAGELEAVLSQIEAEQVPVMARTFPGVPEMLAALQSEATLCLLTNSLPAYLEMACEATGIGKFFAERAASETGVPKAQRIRQWMEARGLPRTLVVGDRSTDISAGREAGAWTLAVTFGCGEADQLTHADATASTVAEMWRHCERFCKGED
ncbi:MAG: HAD family hydrolase [Clostridia bacterium]|nr:HAD family hydrolase [Clostridia bacterium]